MQSSRQSSRRRAAACAESGLALETSEANAKSPCANADKTAPKSNFLSRRGMIRRFLMVDEFNTSPSRPPSLKVGMPNGSEMAGESGFRNYAARNAEVPRPSRISTGRMALIGHGLGRAGLGGALALVFVQDFFAQSQILRGG